MENPTTNIQITNVFSGPDGVLIHYGRDGKGKLYERRSAGPDKGMGNWVIIEELMLPKTVSDKAPDNVNHPSHYTSGKIEVIDFIEDQKLDMHTGNAVNYIARAGKKDPAKEVEDLEKAIWYLKRKISKLTAK